MATESKTTSYLIPLDKVRQYLQTQTGQAPISSFERAVVAPGATGFWTFTLVGVHTQSNYQTQIYTVSATEVAAALNNHAGTSFNAANIAEVKRFGTDSSFIEIKTV